MNLLTRPLNETTGHSSRLAGLDETAAAPTVVASFGLGLDSTSMLTRWLTDPTSRDFDLSELAVVTAMTGHGLYPVWPC